MTATTPATLPAFKAAGDDIVQASRKRGELLNPLVLGSNPSGPTKAQQRSAAAVQRQMVGADGLNELRALPAQRMSPLRSLCQTAQAVAAAARLARLIIECIVAVGLAPFEIQ